MIKINLLPPAMQGKTGRRAAPGKGATAVIPPAGSSALPVLVTALVGVVLFAAVAYGGFMVYSKTAASNEELADTSRKLKKMKSTYELKVKTYEAQFKNWERWKDQEEILQVLMPRDRVLWSRKINMISNAVSAGIFITQMEVQEKVDMIETQRSIKRRQDYEARRAQLQKKYENDQNKLQAELGPAPEESRKPQITQTLIVSAVATGETNTDRFDRMLGFQRALEAYEMPGMKGRMHRFMDGFENEIYFGPMEADMLDGVPVWKFEFRLTTKPMFDSGE